MPEELTMISVVDRLAGGVFTNYDVVYKKNYIECLTTLSLWHHNDLFVSQMNRAMARKYNK
jgi:hypothetical protein